MSTVITDDNVHSGVCAEPGEDAPPADSSDRSIAKLRRRIDELDTMLIRLWRERARLSQQVGTQRVASGGPRVVLAREQQIIHKFHSELGPLGTQLAMLVLRAGRGAL